jgi:alpha/beta superfamily hydrolase
VSAEHRESTPPRLRVQFIHGLEGSPQGSKAQFLAKHFDALTPSMDTGDFAGCVALHARIIDEFRPEVLVGSSFGGAVAVALLGSGKWRGPTLLLAPAQRHFGVEESLPPGVAVIVAHGTRDDVVDIEGSRGLVRSSSAEWAELLEVDDDHRLESLVTSGRLAELVREVARRVPR